MSLFRPLLATAALVAVVPSAPALMIAVMPVQQRIATADAVVIGKVVGFEDKTVEAARFPGDTEKSRYMVAIVKVEDGLLGAKGVKEIRVGFIPSDGAPTPTPGGRPGGIRPGIRRMPPVNLFKDQEACLLLTKHAEADFYIVPAFYDAIQKKDNPNFDKEVADVRHSAGLLADPKAGLAAKDAQDRFLTAGMLITRYRTARPSANQEEPKQEPIDAAESKAILKALADADWGKQNQPVFRFTPQMVFSRLDLTEKDGWKQPQDFAQFPEEAKKWLEANAQTYRIQRFVRAEKK